MSVTILTPWVIAHADIENERFGASAWNIFYKTIGWLYSATSKNYQQSIQSQPKCQVKIFSFCYFDKVLYPSVFLVENIGQLGTATG